MDPQIPQFALTWVDIWTGVVSVGLPLLIAAIMARDWNEKLETVLSALVIVIASIVSAIVGGYVDLTNLNWQDTGEWLKLLGITFTITKTSYEHFWKSIGLDGWLKENFLVTPKKKVEAIVERDPLDNIVNLP
jgi:type III secretory pathway component EscS